MIEESFVLVSIRTLKKVLPTIIIVVLLMVFDRKKFKTTVEIFINQLGLSTQMNMQKRACLGFWLDCYKFIFMGIKCATHSSLDQ